MLNEFHLGMRAKENLESEDSFVFQNLIIKYNVWVIFVLDIHSSNAMKYTAFPPNPSGSPTLGRVKGDPQSL